MLELHYFLGGENTTEICDFLSPKYFEYMCIEVVDIVLTGCMLELIKSVLMSRIQLAE